MRREHAVRLEHVAEQAQAASTREQEVPSGEIPSCVRAALSELRSRNALVITWVHVVLRAALTVIFARAAAIHSGPFYRAAPWISAGFLACSIMVLALLWRRWSPRWAIRLLLLLDLASLTIGGWRVTHALPPNEVGLGLAAVVALSQLMLLSGGLVLSTAELAALGAAATISAGFWFGLAGASSPALLALVAGVSATSFLVIWVGRWIVRLAIRESLESYSARVLRAHRDEVDAANRRISESQAHAERLTQLIVHDLKNPLTAVLTYLAIVHQRISAISSLAEEAEDLRIARSEGERLSSMIGDLLLVARLEKGDLRLQRAPVEVERLILDVGRALRGVSAEKKVALETDVAPGLVMAVDAGLVRRLIENLVSNALRYTRAGDRIGITASLDAGELRLAVRNTGPAVAKAVRARLFEKHSTDDQGEWHNVGLGLYLCRLVAEAHGGRIALVERVGWNVSFEAVLPRPATSPGTTSIQT